MKLPPPIPSKKKRVTVPPPSRRTTPLVPPQSKRAPASVEPPTLKRRTLTSTGPSLMQITAEIDRMSPSAKRRFLDLIPTFAEALDGSSAEFNRRFVELLRAILPVLKARTSDSEKRVIEIVRAVAVLSNDHAELVLAVALALAPPGD